jgi:hypothetical protein
VPMSGMIMNLGNAVVLLMSVRALRSRRRVLFHIYGAMCFQFCPATVRWPSCDGHGA